MYAKVGAIKAASGTVNPLRSDQFGSLMVQQAGGSLADAALAGRLFSVANQAVVTTTAALATTWTGLGVGNPTGSGKLYVFHEFSWAQDIANSAEGAVGLMIATNGAEGSTGMSQSLTARCARYGYATSNALCDAGATIGTPILVRLFGGAMEGAISTAPVAGPNIYDLKGSIIIPAGYALLTYTFAIETTCMYFHFLWEEIDA